MQYNSLYVMNGMLNSMCYLFFNCIGSYCKMLAHFFLHALQYCIVISSCWSFTQCSLDRHISFLIHIKLIAIVIAIKNSVWFYIGQYLGLGCTLGYSLNLSVVCTCFRSHESFASGHC